METMITKILTMSVTAGVVILLVLVLRLALRKMPKAFSYALWAVVLFRLLCPVSLSSNMSLFRLFDTPNAATEYVEPASHVGGTVTGSVRNENGGVAVKDEVPEIEVKAKPVREITPAEVLTFVWLAGVLGMAGYSLVKYVQLRKRLREAVPLRDNIYIADRIDTAFVMGLVRPKIYIPSSVEERDMTHIIAHEEYHIRRLDHVTKFLAYAALCIHWFNPLVWAAFILSGNDMEMSCDEAVIRKLGEGVKAEYSASLLALTTGRQIIAGTPLAFAERNAKGRIMNLANMKRPRVWISLVLALSCLLFTVACGTNSKPATPPKKEEAETETETAQITDPATEGTAVSAETTSKKEPIVLVDDVPRDTYDVFEGVTTPYQFFQKVKAEDIDGYGGVMWFDGAQFQLDVHDAKDELLDIMSSIKESEITELSVPQQLRWDENDGCLTITFDNRNLNFCYNVNFYYFNDGHVELEFVKYGTTGENSWFYNQVNWRIENEALNSFFREQQNMMGGIDGPTEIEITSEPITISGDEIGKYYFRTELDKVIVTVEVPFNQYFCGYLAYEGSGGSVSSVETDSWAEIGDDKYVYMMTPMFSDTTFRFTDDLLKGCTVTLRAERGYT